GPRGIPARCRTGDAVSRLHLSDSHRSGQIRAGRRAQLCRQWGDARGLRADCVSGRLSSERCDELHREPGRCDLPAGSWTGDGKDGAGDQRIRSRCGLAESRVAHTVALTPLAEQKRMNGVLDYPWLVFVLAFLALWSATWLGASILRTRHKLQEGLREDFSTILVSTLTLNGLIIGFSFSMAINRYDQRKIYEEAEANAIGTEYVRAGLVPGDDAARVRSLLSNYLDQRILFYRSRDVGELQRINAETARLQADLWGAVRDVGVAHQTPIIGLVVAGMNDVLNSQGYTQAAWWNRIPVGAWVLMAVIAIVGNLMIGYGAEKIQGGSILVMVLPFVFSVSFLLIADIDSPRGGLIRVIPQNLVSLAASLRAPPRMAAPASSAQ